MGNTFVAKVLKKKSIILDKNGNVISNTESTSGNDIKEKMKKRAERLGLKFKE